MQKPYPGKSTRSSVCGGKFSLSTLACLVFETSQLIAAVRLDFSITQKHRKIGVKAYSSGMGISAVVTVVHVSNVVRFFLNMHCSTVPSTAGR